MDIPVHLRALKPAYRVIKPALENALVAFGVHFKPKQNEKTNQKTQPQQENNFKPEFKSNEFKSWWRFRLWL